MNTKISKKPGPWMLALLLAAAGAGLACQQEAGSSPAATPVASAPAPAAGVQTASLRKIEDPKKVCMVNNTVFEKDQIPVQVSGKTYYGCCEMCKERLAKDAAARTGTDPVTGKPVDKATAIIAALEDGSVLYFESEKTLEQYSKGGKEPKK